LLQAILADKQSWMSAKTLRPIVVAKFDGLTEKKVSKLMKDNVAAVRPGCATRDPQAPQSTPPDDHHQLVHRSIALAEFLKVEVEANDEPARRRSWGRQFFQLEE